MVWHKKFNDSKILHAVYLYCSDRKKLILPITTLILARLTFHGHQCMDFNFTVLPIAIKL